MDFLKDKIRVTLRELEKYRKTLLTGVDGFTYLPCAPKTDNTLPAPDAGFVPFTGEDWSIGRDSHAWFYKHLVLPQEYRGRKVRFQVLTGTRGWNVNNPQFIVYVNGVLRQGLDVNHISLPLGTDGEYDLYLYAYSGALAQDLKFFPSIYVTDEAVEKLWYDLRVPFELLDCLNPLGKEYADILGYLNRAVNCLDLRQAPDGGFAESVKIHKTPEETYCATEMVFALDRYNRPYFMGKVQKMRASDERRKKRTFASQNKQRKETAPAASACAGSFRKHV